MDPRNHPPSVHSSPSVYSQGSTPERAPDSTLRAKILRSLPLDTPPRPRDLFAEERRQREAAMRLLCKSECPPYAADRRRGAAV
jgi:hypothetical protein